MPTPRISPAHRRRTHRTWILELVCQSNWHCIKISQHSLVQEAAVAYFSHKTIQAHVGRATRLSGSCYLARPLQYYSAEQCSDSVPIAYIREFSSVLYSIILTRSATAVMVINILIFVLRIRVDLGTPAMASPHEHNERTSLLHVLWTRDRYNESMTI